MFTLKKDFLPYFNSIKNKVKEFGYFGCDELYINFPITNSMNMFVLATSYREKNNEILGVKTKFIRVCDVDEITLPDLHNYDVLEDIKIYDSDKNEYDFTIIACDDENGSCEMINGKTILLYGCNKKYKIHMRTTIDIGDDKDIFIEGYGYTFHMENRTKLLEYI